MYYVQSVAIRLAIIENTSTETSWGIVLGLKEDSFIRRCFPFGNANLISSVYYFKSGHRELPSFSGAVLIRLVRLCLFPRRSSICLDIEVFSIGPLCHAMKTRWKSFCSHIWPVLSLLCCSNRRHCALLCCYYLQRMYFLHSASLSSLSAWDYVFNLIPKPGHHAPKGNAPVLPTSLSNSAPTEKETLLLAGYMCTFLKCKEVACQERPCHRSRWPALVLPSWNVLP